MADYPITSGGKEYVQPAIKLFVKAFEHDPIMTYVLNAKSHEEKVAILPLAFKGMLTAAAMNDASFVEANDWESCTTMIPPGHRVDNPLTMLPAGLATFLWKLGPTAIYRMLGEYGPLVDKSKAKALGKQKKYYYVFFTATHVDGRGKGLCSTLLKKQQVNAAREGVPLWLEATTPHSRDIYSRLGFKIIDEIVLGKGKANADGTPCKGGPGVKTWTMLWWPEKS